MKAVKGRLSLAEGDFEETEHLDDSMFARYHRSLEALRLSSPPAMYSANQIFTITLDLLLPCSPNPGIPSFDTYSSECSVAWIPSIAFHRR